MAKRHTILIIATAICVFAAVVWVAISRGEPRYKGRSLSSWLVLNPDEEDGETKRADAIRHIGPSAIPWLLQWIDSHPTRYELALRRAFGALVEEPTDDRADLASIAFSYLGTNALPAVPQLTVLLHSTNSDGHYAAAALARLGPIGVPPLIQAMTNTQRVVRCRAIWALALAGKDAVPAIPSLIDALQSNDPIVSRAACETLGKLHIEPSIVVPTLLVQLEATNSRNKMRAANALKEFGPRAKPAIPALTNLIDHRDRAIADAARRAIQAIDPSVEVPSRKRTRTMQ